MKQVQEASQGLILHVHVARDIIRRNKIGLLIFAFVLEIRPILFPHTSLRAVHATPSNWIRAQISKPKYSSSNPTEGTISFLRTDACILHPYFG